MHNLSIAAGLHTEEATNGDIKDITTEMMPLDTTAWRGESIFECFQEKISTIFAKSNIEKHLDNPNTRVLSNFIRYMKCWERERIELCMCYYVKKDLGGMILAQYSEVMEFGFSDIYVAKTCSYRSQEIEIPSEGSFVLARRV